MSIKTTSSRDATSSRWPEPPARPSGVGGGLTRPGRLRQQQQLQPAAAAAGATGRTIKVGFVSPLTGSLATFGGLDQYCVTAVEASRQGRHQGGRRRHPPDPVHRQGLAV